MFFAKVGKYEATGLYGIGHLILLSITILSIMVAIKKTKNKGNEEIKKIIKTLTVIIWILEIIKIVFNIAVGNADNINNYIPLYFCSIILYAGIFSGWGEGWLKRLGDVFIATGGIVGGLSFLLCPITSLTMYPIFHYISIQSFILHGIMVYLGILINFTHYIELRAKDILYYMGIMLVISIIALIVNNIYDGNLMFISKDYPGTPIHYIYTWAGKWFGFWMVLIQATAPFYMVFMCKRRTKNEVLD